MRGPLRVTLGPPSPCDARGKPLEPCNRGTPRCSAVHGPVDVQTFTWEDVSGRLPVEVRGDPSEVYALEVRHGDTHLVPIFDGGLPLGDLAKAFDVGDEPADLVVTLRNKAAADRFVEIEVVE